MVEQEMVDLPLDRHLVEIAFIRRRACRLAAADPHARPRRGRPDDHHDGRCPARRRTSRLYANDVLDELRLIVADLAPVSDRCLGLLELHASLASDRQNTANRQLAAVATVFLPITLVVSLLWDELDVLVR